MTHQFEHMSYDDTDRIAMLENKAAELERRLLAALPNVSIPRDGRTPPRAGRHAAVDQTAVYDDDPYHGDPSPQQAGTQHAGPMAGEPADREPTDDGPTADGASGGYSSGYPDGRTEALINGGRQRARRSRARWVAAHWRMVAVGGVALLLGIAVALLLLPSGGGSWPASVAQVQSEIKEACANPDVAAEPSGLNFACDKDTQQVLWVFSLLTSGDNPGFVDQVTGRKGLEPIQPSQGGDIAWSLNLHHPYNPASPIDSLEVAARAINNIISGATLTSASGGLQVEPGLDSKAANCLRYTGSAQLVTKKGYPARCAAPVTSGAGEAALVSDVFQQWMGGTPAQIATEAGVLFENAGNPGDPRVQAILGSLPESGL